MSLPLVCRAGFGVKTSGASLVAKLPFQAISASITLTDVLLFTNYSGMDPESNSNNPSLGGIGGFGIDYGNMGRPLAVNFGLRLKL